MLNGDRAHFFDGQIIDRSRLNISPKGIEARMGTTQRAMSSYANSHCVSLMIFALSGSWNVLNGKARTNLVTIDLCEGWGTFFVENVTMIPSSFPS